MCGICGIFNPSGIDDSDGAAIPRMTGVLKHRGPDDSGIRAEDFVALGHRRLSIVDLAGGSQPMPNEDGTVWTVFNGEIYNFKSLMDDLRSKGHVFKTRSDTEALVHGYEEYGSGLVEKLDGMFAFAVWDGPRRRLLLARDRVGKKPLYYTRAGGRLLFASEIKSLLLHPAVERRMNPVALHHMYSFQHVPGEDTAFEGIKKLPPAHMLFFDGDCEAMPARYWLRHDIKIDKRPSAVAEAQNALPGMLRDAVRARLMGDVPLGAFLSGGLDSSAVVALMAGCAGGEVHTFSIGFDQPEFDETSYARLVAKRFGTHHTEFTVTSKELMEAVPKLVWHCDEPVADSSILPTYYLSKMTREHVTVALSGDGGDELFGGYERYAADAKLHVLNTIPLGLRKILLAPIFAAAGKAMGQGKISHRLEQLAMFAPMSDAERHLNWLSYFTQQEKVSLYKKDFEQSVADVYSSDVMRDKYKAAAGAGRDFTAVQLLVDFLSYLPETLMMKVDRASMACSLEVRCPILSKDVVELAMSIPGDVRVKGGVTKWFMKESLRELLPAEIIDRRKKGFEVPLNAWFRGPLRDVVRGLLTDQTAAANGIFDGAAVKKLIDEHESGNKDHGHKLWSLLSVELWRRLFFDGPAPEEPRAFF